MNCIRRRNTSGLVLEINSKIVAYIVFETYKDHAQLINLAVKPDMRFRGYGRTLINHVADFVQKSERKRISLELRETNLSAQLFLQRCKFRATEVVRKKYEDTQEDAFKMEYRAQWPKQLTKYDKKGHFMIA